MRRERTTRLNRRVMASMCVAVAALVAAGMAGSLGRALTTSPATSAGSVGTLNTASQIAYSGYQYKDGNGNVVYEQIWTNLDSSGQYLYYESQVHLTSGSNWVVAGGYPWYNCYASVGYSGKTGTTSFSNPDWGSRSILGFTPPNTIIGPTAATWSFGLTGTVGGDSQGGSLGATFSWSVNLPEFEQTTDSLTMTNAAWSYYDNQALNGPNPTATTFTAGVSVGVLHGNWQEIQWNNAGIFETDSWCIWNTYQTDTVTWSYYSAYVS